MFPLKPHLRHPRSRSQRPLNLRPLPHSHEVLLFLDGGCWVPVGGDYLAATGGAAAQDDVFAL